MPHDPLKHLLTERRRGMLFTPRVGEVASHSAGNGWLITDDTDFEYLNTYTTIDGAAESTATYLPDPYRVAALVFTRPDADTGRCVEDVAAWELALEGMIGTVPAGFWGDGDETVSGVDMHYIAGWHGSLDKHYYHVARTILTIDGMNAACLVYASDTDQTYSREDVEAFLLSFIAQVSRA